MHHILFVASPLAGALALALVFPAHAAPTTASMNAAPGSVETTAAGTGSASSPAAAKEFDTIEVHGDRGPPQLSSPKFTRPVLDTPQSVTVVPARLMQEQGVTTLRDALRNVPGISMQAGEGGVPAGDNLSLRGFSARTDLFVDGVRDFGGYSRDPFNLEQIEVLKGPASAQSGRGSTGGTINLVGKTAYKNSFSRVGISAGDNALLRGTADFNQGLGDSAALRINLMAHRNEINGRDVVKTRDSEDRIISNVTDLSMGFATRTVQHDLVAGLELSHERSRNRSRSARWRTSRVGR